MGTSMITFIDEVATSPSSPPICCVLVTQSQMPAPVIAEVLCSTSTPPSVGWSEEWSALDPALVETKLLEFILMSRNIFHGSREKLDCEPFHVMVSWSGDGSCHDMYFMIAVMFVVFILMIAIMS